MIAAYGKVFMVRKLGGKDSGILYAMKVLKKATIVTKTKTTGKSVHAYYMQKATACNSKLSPPAITK